MFSDYVIELCDKTRLWLETAPANCGILLFFTIGFLVSIWNLLYSSVIPSILSAARLSAASIFLSFF